MLDIGIIALWHGSIASIPAGWHLCDGTHGTPDLRDRFLVGAGDSYAPDDSGGSSNHTHNFTSDGHNHSFMSAPEIAAGVDILAGTTTDTDTGTTDEKSNLPPYYALAYIMRI